jgi:hypothetical protein
LVCWYWRNCWPSLFKLSFGLLILEELSTITVKTFFCFVDIGGIVDHHCSNFLLVCWYWRNCWPSLLKLYFGLFVLVELYQKKVWTVMVNNSTNINKTKESFNSDGRQFLQYQQSKRKFSQWWSTIHPISTNQKKVWTVMVNNSSNINKPKESLNSDGQQFL